MQNEKEQWKDSILNSLEGIQKASPDDALFLKITQRIGQKATKIIPMNRVRMAAAAAVLLFVLNAFSIAHYLKNNPSSQTEVAVNQGNPNLISDYKLYD
ncbi:MAG: hypothetical protein AB8B69_15120 [Chitinophagales bacterium]